MSKKVIIEDGKEVIIPVYATQNGLHGGIRLSSEEWKLFGELKKAEPKKWEGKTFSLAAEVKRIMKEKK